MSEAYDAPEEAPAATGSAPRRPSVALTAILFLVIAILVLALGVLVVDRERLETELEDARAAGSGSQSAQVTQTAPEPATGADAAFAPSQTDPEILAIIRSQARRDRDDPRATGEPDAPVVLVLYSDFSCPYCTLFATEVEPGLADLVAEGTLRIEWRDLAQITDSSPLAAQAGLAAAEQGRFWEFHDAAYAAAGEGAHPEYTEESLTALAETAGVADLEAFRATMTSEASRRAVAKAKEEAYELGITGTPFLFVGDAVISGYRDLAYVRATVEAQAAEALAVEAQSR